VFSEQFCGRVRRKFDEQESLVNRKYFNAFDMVFRDTLLKEEEEAVNTRETEQLRRLRSRKFCQKDNLVRVYDY
jgi:hypothetical protein